MGDERDPMIDEDLDVVGHDRLMRLGLEHRLTGNRRWVMLQEADDGQRWLRRHPRMTVIWSIAWQFGHEQPWLHISMARRDIIPSYEDMAEVREFFIAPDQIAYQVFPPRYEYVNLHERCLHLWVPLHWRVTPPFHGVFADGQRTI